MFSPTNIDEVSIQATHLEANKVKHRFKDMSRRPQKFENKSKGKGKSKNIAPMKKDGGKTYMFSLQEDGTQGVKMMEATSKVITK